MDLDHLYQKMDTLSSTTFNYKSTDTFQPNTRRLEVETSHSPLVYSTYSYSHALPSYETPSSYTSTFSQLLESTKKLLGEIKSDSKSDTKFSTLKGSAYTTFNQSSHVLTRNHLMSGYKADSSLDPYDMKRTLKLPGKSPKLLIEESYRLISEIKSPTRSSRISFTRSDSNMKLNFSKSPEPQLEQTTNVYTDNTEGKGKNIFYPSGASESEVIVHDYASKQGSVNFNKRQQINSSDLGGMDLENRNRGKDKSGPRAMETTAEGGYFENSTLSSKNAESRDPREREDSQKQQPQGRSQYVENQSKGQNNVSMGNGIVRNSKGNVRESSTISSRPMSGTSRESSRVAGPRKENRENKWQNGEDQSREVEQSGNSSQIMKEQVSNASIRGNSKNRDPLTSKNLQNNIIKKDHINLKVKNGASNAQKDLGSDADDSPKPQVPLGINPQPQPKLKLTLVSAQPRPKDPRKDPKSNSQSYQKSFDGLKSNKSIESSFRQSILAGMGVSGGSSEYNLDRRNENRNKGPLSEKNSLVGIGKQRNYELAGSRHFQSRSNW